MGEIIEFIFGNMFLFIVIISGIIGVLSNNKKEQNKQEQRNSRRRPMAQQPQPSRTPSGPRQEKRQQVSQAEMKSTKPDVISSSSIENEQQAQMERLEAKYGISTASNELDDDDLTHQGLKLREGLKPRKDFSEEQAILKKDIRQSLRNKGLINGIIMAEVLGKPRSLKPYHSVSQERYKR